VLDAARSVIGPAGAIPVKPVEGQPPPKGYRDTRVRTATTKPRQPVAAGRPSKTVLIAAVAGALVVAAVVAGMLLGGGKPEEQSKPPDVPVSTTPLQPPKPDEKGFEEMFAYAQEYWRKNPEDYEGAAAKFLKVQGSAKDTKWELAAEDAAGEVRKAQARAAEAEFALLKYEAGKCSAFGDYDKAVAWLGKPSGKFAVLLADRIKAEQAAIRKGAEEKLSAALAAAEQCSKDGQPEQGIAELDKAGAVKYAAWADRLKGLREQLEKEKLNAVALAEKRRKAEALKQLGSILDGMDEQLLAGRFAEGGEASPGGAGEAGSGIGGGDCGGAGCGGQGGRGAG